MKKFNAAQIIKLVAGKNLNQTVKLICGEQIGEGLFRDVYVLKQNPEYVVKVERNPRLTSFCNVMEWRHYNDNKEWEWFVKWLAPCVLINETGQVLIQRRVTHGPRKDYPKYVPAVFTDLKVRNFGFADGKFMCCDYAYLVLYPNKPMRYAKWWGKLK